ncbi:ER membrane protein complex subunit 10 [Sipha flava]|uniref:ER membrane protein complex subunit 10 n=1 Tax=Sipha flava TaxID=143950 RepID=A0A8B8FYC5_9HEMI|nr:ER membrane protein complex subunit 10 [Sipha flava]
MINIKKLLCLFCIVNITLCISDLSYDTITDIYVEHELIPGAGFTKRSSIAVSLETKNDVLSETNINDSDLQLLKELAFNNEIYRLKVTVKTLSGKETSFLSFTKACLIIGSKLKDILTLHLDHLDSPFAVNLATTSNSCDHFNELNTNKFTTTVFFRRPENSPVPDTATYIHKMEREREAREKGKSNNNKSMLGKYWMYIVPLVIFMMVAGASNPEGRQ